MEFTGITVSPGKIKGRILILHSENHKDIDEIFFRCTDEHILLVVGVKPHPALINRCAGMLAIFGGVNSHVSIGAREHGKPAIVNLAEDILDYLKDEDWVELDGDSGVVRRMVLNDK
ncbi:MAG: PEP-utilizing enzyme [Candidatus Magasanikbacteria bacterium]